MKVDLSFEYVFLFSRNLNYSQETEEITLWIHAISLMSNE